MQRLVTKFAVTASIAALILAAPVSIDLTSTGLSLIPQVGYFVSDGLEIGGTLDLGVASSKDSGAFSGSSSASTFGLGAKGGYYFKVGDSGASHTLSVLDPWGFHAGRPVYLAYAKRLTALKREGTSKKS